MRLLFTALILTMFAKPACAELVFYCEPTHAVQVTKEGGVRGMNIDRFKFKLTKESIIFRNGSDGWFGNLVLPGPWPSDSPIGSQVYVDLSNKMYWAIRTVNFPDTPNTHWPMETYLFSAPDFSYSQTVLNLSVTIHASCEQF